MTRDRHKYGNRDQNHEVMSKVNFFDEVVHDQKVGINALFKGNQNKGGMNFRQRPLLLLLLKMMDLGLL